MNGPDQDMGILGLENPLSREFPGFEFSVQLKFNARMIFLLGREFEIKKITDIRPRPIEQSV